MNSFPTGINFKFAWRSYQQRVLDELEEHLEDDHLNIIAPPGSGKTVLGLEVMLRLDKPTLILAPSIAIRNQWVNRFCEFFLQTKSRPDWITTDIKNPRFLTVATYQAMHAAMKLEENDRSEAGQNTVSQEESLLSVLQSQNIKTLVADEAHHLKNAWWKSLSQIKNELDPTIIGLTATPPYDVSRLEWKRYIEFNGPVDAEISVPELVREKDLCPHQDLVIVSNPTKEEREKIANFRSKVEKVFEELRSDSMLIEALQHHPIFTAPEENLERIYTNLENYSATLIFLHSAGVYISPQHLEIISESDMRIPDLNYDWMEIVLSFFLFQDPEYFSQYEEHQEKILRKLRRNGIIDHGKIRFEHNSKVNRHLISSLSKLSSIEKIVDFESKQLQENLRMVVLTDFIRKEYKTNQSENTLALSKIGVLPIFEQLRRGKKEGMQLGVLTGSIVIIHSHVQMYLEQMVASRNLPDLATKLLPYDPEYLELKVTHAHRPFIVEIMTHLFQEGHIHVLIGTKSLLGEGWDAPVINALVLASNVGSFVMSNQMRGRAIRTEQGNPSKVSNIYHLLCMDVSSSDGGDDFAVLKRRFKSFVGLSFNSGGLIQNGISRVGLSERLAVDEIDLFNNKMLAYAEDRKSLKSKWDNAIVQGKSILEEVKVDFPENVAYEKVKELYYNRTIKGVIGALGSAVLGFGFDMLNILGKWARHIQNLQQLTYLLMGMGSLGVIVFGRSTYKTLRVYIQYRDIAKDTHKIAEALLQTLVQMEEITTDIEDLEIVSNVDKQGAIYCSLEGGTNYERSLFIESLEEIISFVDNPRYIMIRRSSFIDIYAQSDYHSVPEIIGSKKSNTVFFESMWNKIVGKGDLVYTRTIEGRKILLKSRLASLASEFENKTERIRVWR